MMISIGDCSPVNNVIAAIFFVGIYIALVIRFFGREPVIIHNEPQERE